MDYRCGPMEANLKDFGAMIWPMALVDLSLQTVMSSRVNGLMTKLMEKVITIMLKEQPIKDNGMRINKKEEEGKPGQMAPSSMAII